MVDKKHKNTTQVEPDPDYDFSKFIKTKLERRVMDHFEAVVSSFDHNMAEAVVAQAEMISHSLAGITKMYEKGGYVNGKGIFVSLGPRDMLFLQQAMDNALRLRSDILMMPMGLEATANFMKLASDMTKQQGKADPNVGLSEPPPLNAIDGESDVVEDNTAERVEKKFDNKIKEQAPKLKQLPLKTVDAG